MTTAAWWWAKDKEAVSAPPSVNPPILVDPAEQDIWEGKVYDMYVDNVGGAAESWVVDWLPNGLAYEEFGDRLRIYGTVAALRVPVIVNPGQQNWYVGENIDLTVNLDLSTGDPADTITAIPLVSGLSITESSQSHIRITGIAGIPIIDPADVQDRTYYTGQEFDFEIKNIGSGSATWDTDQLPDGLAAQTVDGFTLRIWGVVGGVSEAPSIVYPGIQVAEYNVPYSLQLYATNFPTSWDATGLPQGLSIDDSGLISGTPTTPEHATASVTATNSFGTSDAVEIEFTIHGAATDPPSLINPGDQTVTEGEPYTLIIRNIGGPVAEEDWIIRDGWLPSFLGVTYIDSHHLRISDAAFAINSPGDGIWSSGSSVVFDVDYNAGLDGYTFLNLDKTLKVWWRFDNNPNVGEDETTVYDWSGNGFAATITNASYTTGRFGPGAVAINDVGLVRSNRQTFFMEIEEDEDITGAIWARTTKDTIHNDLFALAGGKNNDIRFYIHTNGGLALGIGDSNSDPERYYITVGNLFPADGQWHHAAFVVKKPMDEVRFYVDGDLVQSFSMVEPIGYQAFTQMSAGGDYFKVAGAIDELLLFTRALDDNEIKALTGIQADNLNTSKPAIELSSLSYDVNYVDVSGTRQIQSASITVDNASTGPDVTLLAPVSSNIPTSSYSFKFSASVTNFGATLSSATIYRGPDVPGLVEGETIGLSGESDTGTFSVTGIAADGIWNVVVRDSQGNETTTSNAAYFFGNNDFYVATDGNDGNEGTSGLPFLTIQKFCDIARAGDTCTIRAGTYRESATLSTSGNSELPITIKADTAATVVIDGTDLLTGWTNYSGNIYQATFTSLGLGLDQVFVDGSLMIEARTPSASTVFDTPRPSKTIESGSSYGGGQTTIVDSSLTEPDNFWVGATVHGTWSPRYHAYTGRVISSTSGQLVCDDDSAPYGTMDSYGEYYILGGLNSLTQATEWAVAGGEEDDTLYLWAPGNADPSGLTVEVKQRQTGLTIDASYVNVSDIETKACNIVLTKDSRHVALDNLTCNYVNHETILNHRMDSGGVGDFYSGLVINGQHNSLTNSTVYHSALNAVSLRGRNNTVDTCTISHANHMQSECACISSGRAGVSDHLINSNTLSYAGRSLINYSKATRTTITNNEFFETAFDGWSWDLGGIYGIASNGQGMEIAYNYFHDLRSYGLYLDNFMWDYEVHHNIVGPHPEAWYVAILANDGSGKIKFHHNTADGDIIFDRYDDFATSGNSIINNIGNIRIRVGNTEVPFTPEEGVYSNCIDIGGWTEQQKDDLFVDRPNMDYHLSPTSQAIDYGIDLGYTVDYDGNPRNVGDAPDAGAYEDQ